MKRLINLKILSILSLTILLSGCITNMMWHKDMGGASIYAFFIDKENNRVVLVGRKNPETKVGMNYEITEPTGKILRIFEMAQKSNTYTGLSIMAPHTKGKKFYGGLFLSFKITNLSDDDLKFVKDQGFTNKKFKDYVGSFARFTKDIDEDRFWDTKTIRYSSSKEKFTNFCSKANQDPNCAKIIEFESDWEGPVSQKNTIPEVAAKTVATPFTVVADVLLIPLQLLLWIAVGIGGGA